jgi:Protein of unknown function (DUF4085)
MIFYTRELFAGTQPNSGWEGRASREWRRRAEIHARYAAVIAPLLPAPVVRLCDHGLHDGVIRRAARQGDELVMVVDTTNALTGFRGSAVRLTFRGVRGRPAVSRLAGEWWLYQEAHLSSRARFSLHVLFNEAEIEIEADGLSIDLYPRAGGRRSAAENAVAAEPGAAAGRRPFGSDGV